MSLAVWVSRLRRTSRTSPLRLVPRARLPTSRTVGGATTPFLLNVGPDDDLESLYARLQRTPRRQLVLALRPEARVLRGSLHYRLLLRFADELGLELVVATDEPERRRLARESGFRVQALPAASRWRPRLVRLASVAAAVFLLAVAAAGLPRTQVLLVLGTTLLDDAALITVDLRSGAPGVGAGWVAGKTLTTTFEIEQPTPTTGHEAIGDTRAIGYVTLEDLRSYAPRISVSYPAAAEPPTAEHGRSRPDAHLGGALGEATPGAPPDGIPMPVVQIELPPPPPERVVPAGTALLAHDGQRFFTEAPARLAAGGYATVPIVAELLGPRWNVPVGAINRVEDGQGIDTHELRIKNRLPTYGGTDRQYAAVAPEDRAMLRQGLEEQAAAEAPARLFAQADTNYLVVPETVTWSLEAQYDYAVGQRTGQLMGRAVVRAQAIGMLYPVVEELAARQWRARLPADHVGVGPPHLAGAPTLHESLDQYLVVSVPVRGDAMPRLDADTLAEQLRGRPLADVRTRLASLPELHAQPQVEVWPAWAPGSLRVDVEIASAE